MTFVMSSALQPNLEPTQQSFINQKPQNLSFPNLRCDFETLNTETVQSTPIRERSLFSSDDTPHKAYIENIDTANTTCDQFTFFNDSIDYICNSPIDPINLENLQPMPFFRDDSSAQQEYKYPHSVPNDSIARDSKSNLFYSRSTDPKIVSTCLLDYSSQHMPYTKQKQSTDVQNFALLQGGVQLNEEVPSRVKCGCSPTIDTLPSFENTTSKYNDSNILIPSTFEEDFYTFQLSNLGVTQPRLDMPFRNQTMHDVTAFEPKKPSVEKYNPYDFYESRSPNRKQYMQINMDGSPTKWTHDLNSRHQNVTRLELEGIPNLPEDQSKQVSMSSLGDRKSGAKECRSSHSIVSLAKNVKSEIDKVKDDCRRAHKCPVCGKTFKRPSSFRIHYAIHTGLKNFKCNWKGCGKSFNVKSNLTRHQKLHVRDVD